MSRKMANENASASDKVSKLLVCVDSLGISVEELLSQSYKKTVWGRVCTFFKLKDDLKNRRKLKNITNKHYNALRKFNSHVSQPSENGTEEIKSSDPVRQYKSNEAQGDFCNPSEVKESEIVEDCTSACKFQDKSNNKPLDHDNDILEKQESTEIQASLVQMDDGNSDDTGTSYKYERSSAAENDIEYHKRHEELKDDKDTSSRTVQVYCRRRKQLTCIEARTMLKSPDDSKLSSFPPMSPLPGEVYLFKGEVVTSQDWTCDGISWQNIGVRQFPKVGPSLRVRYYKLRHGCGFFRRSFSLINAKSKYELVQYTGNTEGLELCQKAHGNRKSNMHKKHVKTFPSTLRSVCSFPNDKTKAIYRKLSTRKCDNAHMPVYLPKNTEQIKNKMKYDKLKQGISHDDLYSSYEIATTLKHYVWKYMLKPFFLIAFGLKLLGDQLQYTVKSGKSYLSYDTTFNVGDFYVSVLIYKHSKFRESPLIPMAFALHERKNSSVHLEFFRTLSEQFPFLLKSEILIVTDREQGITKAIEEIFPNWVNLFCWNHLLNDIKYWLHKSGGKRDDLTVYQDNVKRLLNCTSFQNYQNELAKLKLKWTQAFLAYYEKNIHEDITEKCGRWILEQHHVYNPPSGITTNISEAFNSLIKKFLNHTEVKLDEMILSMYFLQNYFYNEILRGYCGLGDYTLCDVAAKLNLVNVEFPQDVIDPKLIVDTVKNRIENQSIEKSLPSDCSQGLAQHFVNLGNVSLNSEMKCFNVRGLCGKIFLVTLYPKESCTCPAARTCAHIAACYRAIGKIATKKQRFSLSVIRRKARGHQRAGRKHPRPAPHLEVIAAADSIEATSLLLSDIPSLVTSTPKKGRRLISVSPNTPEMQHAPQPWEGATFPKLPYNNRNIIKTVGDVELRSINFQSLLSRQWLDDKVIDAFLLLCCRSDVLSRLSVQILSFPCHFITGLISKGNASMFGRWIENTQPAKQEVWLFPVNVSNFHWILIAAIPSKKIIVQLDSLGDCNDDIMIPLCEFVFKQWEKKFQRPVVITDWDICAPLDTPFQKNSYDCGVFVCLFAYLICNGVHLEDFNFHSDEVRAWISTEIYGAPHMKQNKKTKAKKEFTSFPIPSTDNLQIHRNCPRGFNSTQDFLGKVTSSLFSSNFRVCCLKDKCQKPTTEADKKVFCDGVCQDWYHCICIDESCSDSSSVSYYCPKCRPSQ